MISKLKELKKKAAATPKIAAAALVVTGIVTVILEWFLAYKFFLLGVESPSLASNTWAAILLGGLLGNMLLSIIGFVITAVAGLLLTIWQEAYWWITDEEQS